MTWTKLGDEFPATARDLTSDEFRLHIEALCWSNKRLLDLQVPKRDLRRLSELDKPEEAAESMAVKGWWEDRGDTWYIGLHFPEWQIEASVEEKRRANTSLRQRRHQRHKVGDHSLCLPGGPCPHAPAPAPSITRPITRYGTRDQTRPPGRVGSGPTDPPDPTLQNRDQDQRQPIANSQNQRVHDGPETVADEAQQFPPDHSESPAAGGHARVSEPAAPARRCEFEGCPVPEKTLPDDRRFHVGCDLAARRAERAQAEAVAS